METDVEETLNRMSADLQNLSETAENICIDAGGREDAHDLAHRAGTLQKALEALRSDVQTLRDEVAG
jgi:ElaB/YqjD/DUF883 family membrane-anchored ribosome-binding protein